MAIVVCWVVIYSYKSHKYPSSVKSSETKKPLREPKHVPPQSELPSKPPTSFPINGIPIKKNRDWGWGPRELTSIEEKTIIECLASQVNIDKEKSFIDYKWGFSMIPGVREIKEDSDEAFYLFTDKGKFFVKINNFSDLARFEYEKESMLAINETVPDLAPRPLVLGNLPNGGKFLVVNFIETRWGDRLIIENQKKLAEKLFQLHQKKSSDGKFGFNIGKNNQWKDNWATFFLENRWQPLWKRVLEKYPQDEELKKWGTIIGEKVIPDLLGDLSVKPVLLHGNLDFDSWDINSQTNQPWLFDAHSYYGHNEMDLSLIHYYLPPDKFSDYRLEKCEEEFSEPDFMAEYQKHYFLPPGFEERRDLYRFYDWLFRNISRGGHPQKKFQQKVLIKMKKIGQKYE